MKTFGYQNFTKNENEKHCLICRKVLLKPSPTNCCRRMPFAFLQASMLFCFTQQFHGNHDILKICNFLFLFPKICIKYTSKLILKLFCSYSFSCICEQIQLAISGDMSHVKLNRHFYNDNLININYNTNITMEYALFV